MGILIVTRPTPEGLRIAHDGKTSNEDPTSEYADTHIAAWPVATLAMRMCQTHLMSIHRCFVLDHHDEVAKFSGVKEQSVQ
ncbi:MAG: hypothetical protein IJ808_05260 [Muribaculaceae bacterium]|nr:hypothetical protein [Muribaculaceae bacterium]